MWFFNTLLGVPGIETKISEFYKSYLDVSDIQKNPKEAQNIRIHRNHLDMSDIETKISEFMNNNLDVSRIQQSLKEDESIRIYKHTLER